MKKTVQVEHHPSVERLQQLGVFSWPIWEKEVSTFDWYYDTDETCYLLEGQVVVTLESGERVEIGAGDFVVFPAGLSCTWQITQRVRKHYRLA